jgi:hypothetical protein
MCNLSWGWQRFDRLLIQIPTTRDSPVEMNGNKSFVTNSPIAWSSVFHCIMSVQYMLFLAFTTIYTYIIGSVRYPVSKHTMLVRIRLRAHSDVSYILPYSSSSCSVPMGSVFRLYLSLIRSPGLFLVQNLLTTQSEHAYICVHTHITNILHLFQNETLTNLYPQNACSSKVYHCHLCYSLFIIAVIQRV